MTTSTTLTKNTTETLLRLSILVFWFMLGVETFAIVRKAPEVEKSLPALLFVGSCFLGFGVAFWYNTRNIAVQTLGWRPVLLLAFQASCGFTVSTDLMYIVAAEIPLVLPARAAFNWIIVQTLLISAWIFWLDHTGQGNLTFMQLPLPHLVIVLLTNVEASAIHAFAFFMGFLAASEARGRREAERLNAELLATQDLLAQSSRLAERTYVARELHDALGHHLVALKVNLELAQHLVTEAAAKTPLEDALALVKRLLSEVREVVSSVKEPAIVDLRQTIQTLVAGVSELKVELVFPDNLTIADPAHIHVLFRCVQEAITNTLKHARAQRLKIAFSKDQHGISLVLQDDGKGATHLHTGLGLKGMRERLESVGGTLVIDSSSKGFTLTAHIPKASRLMP